MYTLAEENDDTAAAIETSGTTVVLDGSIEVNVVRGVLVVVAVIGATSDAHTDAMTVHRRIDGCETG